MKVTEFYPEGQGRPYSPPAIPLDRGGIAIPDGSITPAMLGTTTKNMIYTIPGVYGTGKYGRCRYTIRPGIYGFDKYGSCSYN